MGFAMYSLDVPVVKGSSSLLVFKEDVVSKLETSACIRCGRCGDGCPSHLLPAKLAGFASRNDEAGFLTVWNVWNVAAVHMSVRPNVH